MAVEGSSGSGDDSFEEARNTLRDAIERNIDRASRTAANLDRTLISLSAGAFVFSMTFVSTLAPAKLWLPVLFFAWACFVAAMVLVILAMRSAQAGTEKAIHNAAGHLKQLEANPDFAREIISKLRLPQPIVQKQITKNTIVGTFNNWALIAFIIGILSLATFAAYNLSQTLPANAPSRHGP